MSDELRELSGMIVREPTPWGAVFSVGDVNSPDFGVAPGNEGDGVPAPTFDPNTGLWHSNAYIVRDASGHSTTHVEPWKPPYRWHREPIKRLRVEWARWKVRR